MPDDIEEQEDLRDYLRTREEGGQWLFEVARVGWEGQHEPYLEWIPFRCWKINPDPARLKKATAAALSSPRFFSRCETCKVTHNVGHMRAGDLCCGCAEKHHGIIY